MWCFPGNCLEKGDRYILLERMLERTHDVWKGHKYSQKDSGQSQMVLVHLAILCWSLLGFADAGFADHALWYWDKYLESS